MKKILVINGPNLKMLGKRKKEHYGSLTLHNIEELMSKSATTLKFDLTFFTSNIEGEIVNCLNDAYGKFHGVVINAGAYTHYSYAIADAIEIIEKPVIEVHLSNIHGRDEFRRNSVIASNCVGQISGFKENSYILALYALKDILEKEDN